MLFGAVEAGGTKFVCGIGKANGNILDQKSFPTTTPGETISQMVEYFKGSDVKAIGIGSFGPLDLNPQSQTFGHIMATPKPGWSNTDIVGALKKEFSIPIGFDTDVNAAALGEAAWGAGRGLNSFVYFTVGTGVGAGIYIEGNRVHGLVHPEVGHIPLTRHPDDNFAGSCPYHQDCLEGMASGYALEKRLSIKGQDLDPDHPAWKIEAFYLAQAAVQAILFISPEKIIFGGGVMKRGHLFPLIRTEVKNLLNGYLQHEAVHSSIDDFIVPPALGGNSGLCGALTLSIDQFSKYGREDNTQFEMEDTQH
jgi:fructokinase